MKAGQSSVLRATRQGCRCASSIVVVVIAMLVSGCGSATRTTTVSSASALGSTESTIEATTPTVPVSDESCTSASTQTNIEATYYGGSGNTPCLQWDTAEAKVGEYWKLVTAPLRRKPICAMSKGGLTVELRQEGTEFGNGICAHLLAHGWTETEGPGELAEREQRAAEAKEKAEREQQEAVARQHKEAREAVEQQKEVKQKEREEAAQKHQEAAEHEKEDQERQKEAEKQHQEEAQQHQELERENKRNEEETHRAEREAQRGE
jgi:flagellar biosynthesis GTPase FlhF